MIISFYSVDSDNNETKFESELTLIDNTYIFEDKSLENTIINLIVLNDRIIFKRMGNVDMNLKLEKNKITKGNYKNINGLEFDFECHCDILKVDNKNINLGYNLIVDGNTISYHKILITIYT